MLLFQQVAFVVHGGDHRIDVGQFAPQAEVGGRRTAQLLGHVVVTHDVPVDGTPRGTGRRGRRDVAQRAVEIAPLAQETARRRGAQSVIGFEKRLFEGARGIHLLGLLPVGAGIGRQHQSDRVRQQARVFRLLLEPFAREVAQRIVRRTARTQGDQVFAVVIAVEQPDGAQVARRQLAEDLVEDGVRIESLRAAVERVLPQSGYQTIIIGIEHGGVRL